MFLGFKMCILVKWLRKTETRCSISCLSSWIQVRPVCAVPVVIDVLVCVVHAERLIDGGALVHELYGAPGVGGDVTDGEQPGEGEEGSNTGQDKEHGGDRAVRPSACQVPRSRRWFYCAGLKG